MRKGLPVITEAVETLKQRLQHERDGRKKPRLQMLSLLASGQAQRRREVAQLLGVHRNTIGHGLALYETGGHIPSDLVVECVTAHRKPPDVRIWRLSNQSRVGTFPPSTATPHCPACWARR
jgi:hypothetical protein